jgi:hypothetical protein
MAAKTGNGEYSLKLTGGGISIDKIVIEPIALQILKLVMGDTSVAPGAGGAGAGASAGTAGATSKQIDTSTPKAFMAAKQATSDMDRVTCLAYYLTHTRNTPTFKTDELTALNREAAGSKFSNISATARNAVASGYLSAAGAGKKQIAVRGEAVVEALPDREKVAAALEAHPARKPRKKRKARKAK